MTLSLPKDRSFFSVIFLVIAIAVVFIVYSFFSILRNKNNSLNASRIKSKAQAQLLGENNSNIFYTVDLTLLSIRSLTTGQQQGSEFLPKATVRFIQSESVFLPQIDNIYFINSQGKVTYNLIWLINSQQKKSTEPKNYGVLFFIIECLGRDGVSKNDG